MIDIHSHILPDVDDGAPSWEVAVEMCRIAKQDGVEHMVATPHANDDFAYDRQWLRGLLQELKQRAPVAPALSLGCDCHFSYDNLQVLAKDPHRFTIEDTPYVLVELSDYSVPGATGEMLSGLLQRELRPILTHPERNPILQHNPERVLEWVTLGCLVQLTASSLEGAWGQKAKQVSEWLLRRDAVHVLATDAHAVEWRPPVLSRGREAVEDLTSRDVARALVEDNPAAILRGEPIPYFPPVSADRRARGSR